MASTAEKLDMSLDDIIKINKKDEKKRRRSKKTKRRHVDQPLMRTVSWDSICRASGPGLLRSLDTSTSNYQATRGTETVARVDCPEAYNEFVTTMLQRTIDETGEFGRVLIMITQSPNRETGNTESHTE